ncbi:hypothetical protein [Tolypothrix sp. VBCCA 56010]|uniref:hypothetical protein n=1 Tax=Tolypothrix sp. VBCCA 56010 TaxID=3137731 RepID=UPI003D7D5B23
MGVKRLQQTVDQVAALKAEIDRLRKQEKRESQKVIGRKYRLMGEILDEWLDMAENQEFLGDLNLKALKSEFKKALSSNLVYNYDREIFGLPLEMTPREIETRKLIIKGRILQQWLKWERVLQQDFKQALDEYLTRDAERALFGLNSLDNKSDSGTANFQDDDILSQQQGNQKLILMGRLLDRWVASGKVSAEVYQEGLEKITKYDSDRLLFGLTPRLNVTDMKGKKKTGTKANDKAEDKTIATSEQKQLDQQQSLESQAVMDTMSDGKEVSAREQESVKLGKIQQEELETSTARQPTSNLVSEKTTSPKQPQKSGDSSKKRLKTKDVTKEEFFM